MSGVKRKIEDNDPDYEDILLVQETKRNKVVEHNAREAAVQKIEAIIKEQFSLEMKNKEHEIEVIGQRLNEARRMMDKLRACIVASYYANAGLPKLQEACKSEAAAVLNHPAIRRFLDSPSRSSSPLNQGSDAASLGVSESESLSQQGEGPERDGDGGGLSWRGDGERAEPRPGRNTGKDTFGVAAAAGSGERRVTHLSTGDEASRLYVKKTVVVGNVSKYIPPDTREENDQSTHKWMVYVRGSRREPSIHHFVKKVWFFLHPSYKPNDLVEVSEPPFHLTRRGWGEFPVRIQVHFNDPRNKRIDIIHQLKLDRTYTGLQTLGAETVVDVELHRRSVGEEHLLPALSSSSSSSSSSRPCHAPSPASPRPYSSHTPGPAPVGPAPAGHAPTGHASPEPPSQDGPPAPERGVALKAEGGRPLAPHPAERTPTRPKVTDRVTLGSHGNSAFQPITASCKIVPQGRAPSPAAESPGKSFQPITMSCKIVSGSPISTPSPSPLPRPPGSSSAPLLVKPPAGLSSPYIIVDKPAGAMATAATATTAGSSSVKQAGSAQSPRIHPASFLSSGVKVIIKQEPGEVPTTQQQHQQTVSAVTAQQQHQQPSVATATQQFVSVKGGHVISMSPQKQAGGTVGAGATSGKVLGIPVSSALQSAVKQVALSSGQILVAKGNPSASKATGGKQAVAKAIVGGGAAGGIVGQQVVAKATGSTGGAGKSGVMATLQLPANNLANLANLPPGTKLYLTTNSKNPSGKGKLLLIPQGAILRASTAQQSQGGSSAGSGGSQTGSSSSALPSNLSFTSYILKQTPQGTFLVGQPASQGAGKQAASSGSAASSSPATAAQQAIRVTAGQKAAILAQVVGGAQTSQTVKLSDGSVKTVAAATAAHLSKPGAGTTTLRGDGVKPVSQQQHSVLVAANQAAVINAAKNAAAAAAMAKGNAVATTTKSSAAAATGAAVTVAKSVVANVPVLGLSKGAGSGGVAKSAGTSLVTAASLVGTATAGLKTGATLSGMLKLHPGGSSAQQTVLTLPATQLKQTILMPVSKVVQSSSVCRGPGPTTPVSPSTAPVQTSSSSSSSSSSLPLPLVQVKTEPSGSTPVSAAPSPPVTPPGSSSTPAPAPPPALATATVKMEHGPETTTHEINTEHMETMMHLLTAVVKKLPLILAEKTEDSPPFCASSVEQFYSWNIGKRRASELQRAVAVKRVVQDVLDRAPRLQALSPPKTREVVQWCRQRGFTPPDPEPPRRDHPESIEDILTQIDNEPECVSTLGSADHLVQRLEQMQVLLKTEPDDDVAPDDGPVDIVSVTPATSRAPKVKEEEPEEVDPEPKYFLAPCPSAQFVSETAQQIGVSLQPVEVEKNVFAPVIQNMILKATEQFASDILRESLAGAFAKSPQNRAPREISAANVHQALSSIPCCDFLTNTHMGYLTTD